MKNEKRGRLGFTLLGAAAMAAVVAGTNAFAGSGVGGIFNLGQGNTVNAQTSLSGSTGSSELRVDNTSTSGGYGLRASSAAASGFGVNAMNSGGGSAIQAAVNNNSIPPFKVNSTAVVPHLNADMVDGHSANEFLGCHNGGIWGRAEIDGTAASNSSFTTAGVDTGSQFVCDASVNGSNVLVKRYDMGRWGVVFGDKNNAGQIGIGNPATELAQVSSQDMGKIVSVHGTALGCAVSPPPQIMCWDVRMTDGAGSPTDGSFIITVG